MLKLSIITTLYKSEPYLEKCLRSLVNQDIPSNEYEIIIINDGSPDNSEAIAKSYAKKYSNIQVISQKNKGLPSARNTGIKNASGKYICFVDPDDYIEENSLLRLIQQMDEENLDILRFNYSLVDENYSILSKSRHCSFDYSPKLMSGKAFLSDRLGTECYVWAYIFRRAIIVDNNIWFSEESYFDDSPWLPKVMLVADRVNIADINHYFYYQRSDSLVKSKSIQAIKAKIEGQFFLLNCMKEQRAFAPGKGVVKWYDRVIGHCSISMMSLIGIYEYEDRSKQISRFLELRLRPLSRPNKSISVTAKTVLLNISPSLFCFLMHKKNGQTL